MRNWLWKRSSPVREVVMVMRQGCHLCEVAWQILEQAQQQYGFSLRQVDVDADPALACYDLLVPVVLVDGAVRFRGGVNVVLLNRLLRAKSAPPSDPPLPAGERG